MQFTSIKANLASAIVKQCQEKLTTLALDLSLREGNDHVGSGLGGNNFQMFAMLGTNHHLTNDSITVEVKDNTFIWGTQFLINSPLIDIRRLLDKAFLNLKECNKLMALMFLNPGNINETYAAYEKNFPILKDVFSGKKSATFKNISPHQQIIIAFIMCAKYSFELDNNILTSTKAVGETLASFDPEVLLLAVRKYICIDRIVRHNLDENPAWENLFTNVSRKLN